MKSENTNACPPVLLLIFNRPDLTQQVFGRIRDAHPSQLFIAADGPREDKPGENLLCTQARSVVDQIDWPCQVQTLFREQNLGCKRAVSGAINWFFEHVEQGIILEDDCVPELTFFAYCNELLEYYKNDQDILSICGFNFGYQSESKYSYSFTRYMNMSGWSTWRRSARLIDYNLSDWGKKSKNLFLHTRLRSSMFDFDWKWVKRWRTTFNDLTEKNVDSWGYYWIYAGFKNRLHSIVPHCNLIQNIGFNDSATHTKYSEHPMSKIDISPIEIPLTHPRMISNNVIFEEQYIKKIWHLYFRRNFAYQLWAFYDDVIKSKIR